MTSQVKNLKSITEAVNKMMKNGEQVYDPKNPQEPDFHTYDLYDLFSDRLTEKTKKALANKTTSLIHQRNEEVSNHIKEFLKFLVKVGNQGVTKHSLSMYAAGYRRVIDKVNFIGRVATVDKLEIGVDRVCKSLNRLADKGYITAALTPLIVITLMRTSKRQRPKIAVVSYIAVTAKGEAYLNEKMKKDTFLEGGLPNRI